MVVIGHRIWFADGKVLDSKALSWKDMPKEGVLVIMVYYAELTPAGKPFRRVIYSHDFYSKTGDEFTVSDKSETDVKQKDPDAKKFGLVSDDQMEKTVNLAMAAVDF